MPAREWIQLYGSGTPVTVPGGGGGGGVTPGNPTILAVSVIDVTRASDGRPQKRVTVQYTPPGPLGSFTGVNVYLDHPDSSGTLAIADGTQAADGTVAASGNFTPQSIGNFPFDPANPSVVFEADAPAGYEYWRVYLTPTSNSIQVPVVQFGMAGASPSYQFLVAPPATISTGREFAPLVSGAALSSIPTGWGANPHIASADSGDQYFEFRVTWTWPTFDQNFQTLGGVNIVLDDGVSRKVIGQVWVPDTVQPGVVSVEADALFASTHITVQPGTKAYSVWIVSFNKQGQVNRIDTVTPVVAFNITRNTGTAGQEYTSLVSSDGVHALVTVAPVAGADGTSLLRITGYFAAPSDPSFGGAEIVALKPDGNYYSIISGRLTPLQNDISQPPSVESWTFYLRSIDINGRRNTIVGGTTPSIVLSVGNAGGVLNLARAAGSSFSSEFQISGGVFKVLNLSAATVTTGILQVGGGGGKVSQFKIFDTLGSIIGFIGDDTGGTGYVGAWFKQARIGGTSPSTAPLQADTSGNVSIVNATITSTSGTSTATINAAAVDVQDSSLHLEAKILTGAFLAQSISGFYNGQMALNLWSLLFTDSGSAAVEIGTTSGSTPYFVKMRGIKVLGERQTGPGTPSFASLSDAQTWCSNLNTALRNHGMIT
jgi:hypothetical protein